MSARAGWRGEGGGDAPPRLGRRGRAWMRRVLQAKLFRPDPAENGAFLLNGGDDTSWAGDAVESLIGWYMRNPARYARWVDADEYRGAGYSHGAWTLDENAIAGDLPEAIAYVDRGLDATAHPTLDEWLRAEAAGALWHAGAPSGMRNVRHEFRPESRKATCPCGERFRKDRRNAIHCPTCRAAKRAAREAARGTGRGRRRAS